MKVIKKTRRYDQVPISSRYYEIVLLSAYSKAASEVPYMDGNIFNNFSTLREQTIKKLNEDMGLRCKDTRLFHGHDFHAEFNDCGINAKKRHGLLNGLDYADEPQETKYLLDERKDLLSTCWTHQNRPLKCQSILKKNHWTTDIFASFGKVDFITQFRTNHSYWSCRARSYLAASPAVRSFLALPSLRVKQTCDISAESPRENISQLTGQKYTLFTFLPIPRRARGICLDHEDYSLAEHLRRLLFIFGETETPIIPADKKEKWRKIEEEHKEKHARYNAWLEQNDYQNGVRLNPEEQPPFWRKHCQKYENSRRALVGSHAEYKNYFNQRKVFRKKMRDAGFDLDGNFPIEIFLTYSVRYPILLRTFYDKPNDLFRFISLIRGASRQSEFPLPDLIPDSCSLIALDNSSLLCTEDETAMSLPDPLVNTPIEEKNEFSEIAERMINTLGKPLGLDEKKGEITWSQAPFYWDIVIQIPNISETKMTLLLKTLGTKTRQLIPEVDQTTTLLRYNPAVNNETSVAVSIMVKIDLNEPLAEV